MPRALHLQIRDWAEATLRVPAGPLRGQPLRLGKWQVGWLRGALAPDTHEAGLSVARKNGKSGLVAVALLAHLSGPANVPQWHCLIAFQVRGMDAPHAFQDNGPGATPHGGSAYCRPARHLLPLGLSNRARLVGMSRRRRQVRQTMNRPTAIDHAPTQPAIMAAS